MNENAWRVEGYEHLNWVIIDYVDIVVHIFFDEIRKYSDVGLSELAIRFLNDQNLIDKIIFGIKRKEHVKNLLEQVSKKPLKPIIIKKLFELFENDFGLMDESDYAY